MLQVTSESEIKIPIELPMRDIAVEISARHNLVSTDPLYVYYKSSAWAPAFAGAHASGRAGQYFDKLSYSCPI